VSGHVSIHFKTKVLGGHTHVAVFVGPDADHRAKAGDLTFRNEEWAVLSMAIIEGRGISISEPDDLVDVKVSEVPA
jgi:hypothetical protein